MTNPDRFHYFVQQDFGELGLAWPERTDTSRAALLRDLRSGEIKDVIAILECNPVEHVCSDVFDEIMHAVKHGDHTETPQQRARVYDDQLERERV